MMAIPTLITAILLIVIGIMGYTQQEPNPDTGKVSMTALIPAFIGGVLAICGALAFSPHLRKHAMHFAAMVGLVGFLGGFMPLMRQYNKTGTIDALKPAAAAGLLMILICAIFLGLCVNSFIRARKMRQLALENETSPRPS